MNETQYDARKVLVAIHDDGCIVEVDQHDIVSIDAPFSVCDGFGKDGDIRLRAERAYITLKDGRRLTVSFDEL